MSLWQALLVVSLIGTSRAAPRIPGATAIVDLGYTLQEGILEAGYDNDHYFNFTNVRYAAPPTGPNRFKPPSEPITNRTIQRAGEFGITCLQAQPAWLNYAGADIGNLTEIPPLSASDLPPDAPGSSEDCLFLDVLVPAHVFNTRPAPTLPVLVFIHGGGFVQGSKSTSGPGGGLLNAASLNKRDVIYVSINYRLGIFGFLAGTDTPGFVPNLGLRDQLHALAWVKRYIHLFGGNRDSVTLMGESAGAGSIMYHLTSSEMSQRPFQRAIAQSPYTIYIPKPEQQKTFNLVLQAANASSFSALQQMPTMALQTCNGLVVGNGQPYGTFTFGPVTDGTLYPGHPPALLAQRRNTHPIPMVESHTANEGILFVSPFIKDNDDFERELPLLFPQASQSALATIAHTLYPGDFSGAYGYVDQLGRMSRVIAESTITCNAYVLHDTMESSNASLYAFTVLPAWHGADLPYTFMDPTKPEPRINITLARIMQRYLTQFAATGDTSTEFQGAQPPDPAVPGLMIQNFNNTMIGPVVDTTIDTKRCDWWQKSFFV